MAFRKAGKLSEAVNGGALRAAWRLQVSTVYLGRIENQGRWAQMRMSSRA